MEKGIFLRVSLGPIINKSRFLPFVETNKNTLHNYIYVVDNYETYEPYKDKLTIINVETCEDRKQWSIEKEIIFSEKDPTKFIRGWGSFTDAYNSGHPYPLSIFRLGFLKALKRDILKIVYTGPNVFITDNQLKIDNYFDSLPIGGFTTPDFGSRHPLENTFYPYIKEDFEKLYPDIKVQDPHMLYFDGNLFTFSFKNKQDGLLFYEIWDTVLKLIYEKNIQNILGAPSGYINYEAVISFVMKIFVDNFEYNYENALSYWDNNTLGKHLYCLHDTFLCHKGNEIRFSNQYGFYKTDEMKSVADFITANKEGLIKFYDSYTQYIDYKITEDTVIFKFKY